MKQKIVVGVLLINFGMSWQLNVTTVICITVNVI